MNIVCFDMSLLRYRRTEGRLEVSARHIGSLADVSVPDGLSQREAVFSALDEVLRSFVLPVGAEWCRAGLYNPITNQVAVGEIPVTSVYQAERGIVLDEFGTLGVLGDDGGLILAGLDLAPYVASSRSTHELLSVH